MHRRLTAGLMIAMVAVALAAPAAADGTGDAFNDGDEIGAGARDGGSSARGGGSAGGGGGSNPCRYERLDEAGQDAAQGLADGGWGQQPGTEDGAFYRRICDTGTGQTSASIVWLPAPPAIDPQVLARQALDRTPIPSPEIRLNPPAGQDQVVNVPTWMWIDPTAWAPVSATASAGSVTVTATATPTSVSWDMGNGDVVVCAGPGTPYDHSASAEDQQSDCSYTYRRSSASRPTGAFTMQVTMTWGVTWTATGAPGGGSLGVAQRTTASPVRVAEIQAVNE
jgi:hypothetical protein